MVRSAALQTVAAAKRTKADKKRRMERGDLDGIGGSGGRLVTKTLRGIYSK